MDRRLRDIPSAEMARRSHQEEKVASPISEEWMSSWRPALLSARFAKKGLIGSTCHFCLFRVFPWTFMGF